MDEQGRGSDGRELRWRGWMIAGQGGDAAAYEKLMLDLLPHLRGFIGRRVHDPAATEDVVQNVLISIHRARHTYRPERPFRPWLYAIARNAVIDSGRARQRRSQREISLEVDGVPEPAVEAQVPTDPRLSPDLADALSELPPSQREAVQLIQIEGLTVAEAAAQVGVSPGALKVRAHRGYRAMRARLGARPR